MWIHAGICWFGYQSKVRILPPLFQSKGNYPRAFTQFCLYVLFQIQMVPSSVISQFKVEKLRLHLNFSKNCAELALTSFSDHLHASKDVPILLAIEKRNVLMFLYFYEQKHIKQNLVLFLQRSLQFLRNKNNKPSSLISYE